MSLITDEARKAQMQLVYQQAAARRIADEAALAASQAEARARQAQSGAIEKAAKEAAAKAAHVQAAELKTGERILAEQKISTPYEATAAIAYTNSQIKQATDQHAQLVAQRSAVLANRSKYTPESLATYEAGYKKYQEDYDKFISGSRGNLDVLKGGLKQGPLPKAPTQAQREQQFTAGTKFVVTYTEDKKEVKKTFDNLKDAQAFSDLNKKESVRYVVRYSVEGTETKREFKTEEEAQKFADTIKLEAPTKAGAGVRTGLGPSIGLSKQLYDWGEQFGSKDWKDKPLSDRDLGDFVQSQTEYYSTVLGTIVLNPLENLARGAASLIVGASTEGIKQVDIANIEKYEDVSGARKNLLYIGTTGAAILASYATGMVAGVATGKVFVAAKSIAAAQGIATPKAVAAIAQAIISHPKLAQAIILGPAVGVSAVDVYAQYKSGVPTQDILGNLAIRAGSLAGGIKGFEKGLTKGLGVKYEIGKYTWEELFPGEAELGMQFPEAVEYTYPEMTGRESIIIDDLTKNPKFDKLFDSWAKYVTETTTDANIATLMKKGVWRNLSWGDARMLILDTEHLPLGTDLYQHYFVEVPVSGHLSGLSSTVPGSVVADITVLGQVPVLIPLSVFTITTLKDRGLSNLQIKNALPILLQTQDAKQLQLALQKLDQETLSVVVPTLRVTSLLKDALNAISPTQLGKVAQNMTEDQLRLTIPMLSTNTIQELVQSQIQIQNQLGAQTQLQTMVQSLSTEQLTELVQSLSTTQIQEIIPHLTQPQVEKIKRILLTLKGRATIQAPERTTPTLSGLYFTVRFTGYDNRSEVVNVKADSFHNAYTRARSTSRLSMPLHSVDITRRGREQ